MPRPCAPCCANSDPTTEPDPAMTSLTRHHCQQRDDHDALAPLRQQFELPEGINYLDGNSLGVLPRSTAARVQQVISAEWGRDLIKSWNTAGWIDLPRRVGNKIARLVGAGAGRAGGGRFDLGEPVQGALGRHPDGPGRPPRTHADRVGAQQLSHRPLHRRKPVPPARHEPAAGRGRRPSRPARRPPGHPDADPGELPHRPAARHGGLDPPGA